jgi:hypothetical protein
MPELIDARAPVPPLDLEVTLPPRFSPLWFDLSINSANCDISRSAGASKARSINSATTLAYRPCESVAIRRPFYLVACDPQTMTRRGRRNR